MLLGAPSSPLARLLDEPNIEIRIAGPYPVEAVHAGDRMLVALPLDFELAEPSGLLELTRTTDDGVFDRLASNLQALWDDAEEMRITDRRELNEWLTAAGQPIAVDGEPPDKKRTNSMSSQPSDRHNHASERAETGGTTRRWPGRRR